MAATASTGTAGVTTAHGWKVFDGETPVLTYAYSFGPGVANALAVGGTHGMIVVSPPCRVAGGVLDDVAAFAPVRALVASNAFHHMGLAQWKARFADAAVYAPAQAIARVERRTGLRHIRPLADMADVAGAHVELVDMPHYKTGEVLVRIRTVRGLAWYVTDCIMNMPELPAHPVAKLLFKVSRSAPGLRFNNIAPLFMVKDKASLRRWLASELVRAPPRWILPAHGDIVDVGPNADVVRCLFET